MQYIVRSGDSLIKIARTILKDVTKWKDIAIKNSIVPPYKIYIGQHLELPTIDPWSNSSPGTGLLGSNSIPSPVNSGSLEASLMYGRAFFFVLADEILPSGKVVRKVIQFPKVPADFKLMLPEKYGMTPPNPNSLISIGEHALGSNQSPYLSASTLKTGAPNISGRSVYIDIAKAEKAGAIIHSSEDIIADLNRLVKANPTLEQRVSKLKNAILNVEKEVLIEGNVPAAAIKSKFAMNVTRGLRVVQVLGFVLTAYELGSATQESIESKSTKPIVAETIRQVGGWGGAIAGAKIGGIAGAAVGIETGPGAIVTGAIGAIVFGAAGYFGADWLADFIDEN